MSLPTGYPSPRYHHSTGDVSAVFRPADSTPDLTTSTGGRTDYLATGASTGGDFGLYRMRMGPEPAGTSTHFHKTISESFFVLDGTLSVFDGERWVDATRGDYLYVPPGGLHAFWNSSGEPVDFLMLFTPGAPREGYFEGIRHLSEMNDQERTEFFIRHDSYFTDMSQGPTTTP